MRCFSAILPSGKACAFSHDETAPTSDVLASLESELSCNLPDCDRIYIEARLLDSREENIKYPFFCGANVIPALVALLAAIMTAIIHFS